MPFSVSMLDVFLNFFRGTTATPPANWTVKLLTTAPTDVSGTGLVEVSTGTWTNYAAATVAASTGAWNAPAGGTSTPQNITNSGTVDFGTATTIANVTLVAFALYDGATFRGWGTFLDPSSNPINPIVQNGNPVSFPAGSLKLSMS